MSRISDVSGRLGQYMLTGWILTDVGCNVCSVPMLRSPAGQSPEHLFCAQCQTSPEAPVLSAIGRRAIRREPPPPSTAGTSSTGFSRVSTPPTEVSSTLSSPTFAPPPDPEETLRRRAQSDHASAEIGRRMLRGWALLAEECLNDTCYGVPLVRPPKAGGGKDPRKECVVCGNVYVSEKDSQGMDGLVPLNPTENSSARQRTEVHRDASHASALHVSVNGSRSAILNVNNHENHETPILPNKPVHPRSQSVTSNIPTLDTSVTSLEHALIVLAHKLTALAGQELVDHISVGDIAMSMEKVTNALRAAKQLRLQENSLHES